MLTKRSVNIGAETWMHYDNPVLDKGNVVLRDYMGTDEAIVAAARVSYDKGAGDDEGNARLIEFLMRERHTSPFEHCILTFDIKAPIFVMRELVRHRTARLNEISGRYAVMPDEVYIPTLGRIQEQSKSNKQGSGLELPPKIQRAALQSINTIGSGAHTAYHAMLDMGVTREVARIVLPLNTYSRVRWQCDLHNLFHFLKLRMAQSAQWEIRQYANAMAKVTRDSFPRSFSSWEENVLDAVTLSKKEKMALHGYFLGRRIPDNLVTAMKKVGALPQ